MPLSLTVPRLRYVNRDGRVLGGTNAGGSGHPGGGAAAEKNATGVNPIEPSVLFQYTAADTVVRGATTPL